jgi:hypothetical protein
LTENYLEKYGQKTERSEPRRSLTASARKNLFKSGIPVAHLAGTPILARGIAQTQKMLFLRTNNLQV